MLLVVASVPASAATATATPESSSYAGAHVTFQAESNAVTDYTVNGETMVEAVEVQSESDVKDGLGVGLGADLDLETVTDVEAAGLSVAAESTTQAQLETKSGANLTAHDNADGTLVVAATDSAQVVDADVAANATVEQASDSRVTVTTANGTTGSFIVVGDGRVTVDEEGNVTARLGEDASLVFRSAGEERSEAEQATAELIADGEAAAEVYVVEQDGEAVVDTVTYGSNTTVETNHSAEAEVRLTVDRTTHDGTVVVTHVREEAVGTVENLSVAVDGAAAPEASAFGDLRAATDNGSTSTYMVEQTGNASADADATVYVAVNHFSERTVTMSGAEDTSTATETATGTSETATGTTATNGDTTTDDADETSDATDTAASATGDEADGGESTSRGGSSGFGVGVAVLAVAGLVTIGRLRG